MTVATVNHECTYPQEPEIGGNSGNSGNREGGAMDDAIGPFMWAPITQDASSSPTPALAARSSATPALIATSPAWNVCFHSPPLTCDRLPLPGVWL